MLNGMFGRKVGDEVLKKTADLLTELFQNGICIGCRPDADYFYFYVAHHDDYEDIINGMQAKLVKYLEIPGIRVRAGVYQNVDKAGEVEDRFDHAKNACDRIRGDYTRQVFYYSTQQSDKELYQERLINDIDDAIANKDLVVFYQPKYDIRPDEPRLRSAEALIRWRHPELGMISPGEFIPLFESNGLIQS